jgi:acetyl-CoA synthetase
VTESAVIGVPDEVKGEAIWCFVVANGEGPEGLSGELSALVAAHLGKAFRPARVVVVPELPRTRSAKILRRAIRATVVGEDPVTCRASRTRRRWRRSAPPSAETTCACGRPPRRSG